MSLNKMAITKSLIRDCETIIIICKATDKRIVISASATSCTNVRKSIQTRFSSK